jgi:hypothetical protein
MFLSFMKFRFHLFLFHKRYEDKRNEHGIPYEMKKKLIRYIQRWASLPPEVTVKLLPLPTNLKIVTVTLFLLPAWKNFETVTSFSFPAPQKILNG